MSECAEVMGTQSTNDSGIRICPGRQSEGSSLDPKEHERKGTRCCTTPAASGPQFTRVTAGKGDQLPGEAMTSCSPETPKPLFKQQSPSFRCNLLKKPKHWAAKHRALQQAD